MYNMMILLLLHLDQLVNSILFFFQTQLLRRGAAFDRSCHRRPYTYARLRFKNRSGAQFLTPTLGTLPQAHRTVFEGGPFSIFIIYINCGAKSK